MVWTTRYLGILTYSGIAAILIAKDVVATTEHAIAILAPIAGFIALDQYKHRNDDSYDEE
tara:strand:+ start:730 stop:909 length:180 start_codon:yes stop_codon:yes gene_type:complete